MQILSSPIFQEYIVKKLSKLLRIQLTDGDTELRARFDDTQAGRLKGEVLGVVGESGCGKSTLGRAVLRLLQPTNGKIYYRGADITSFNRTQLKLFRQDAQIIFQDPFGALNPQHIVGKIIAEPMQVHKLGTRKDRASRVLELLDWVDLPADSVHCYPHEFSGGQRQRVAIARATVMRPAVLLAHDPTTFKHTRSRPVDLQISGHTHGGQIWPFNFVVRLAVRWVAGLYRAGRAQLYVSRGTGFWGPPMRLLSPAEITEITLRSPQP